MNGLRCKGYILVETAVALVLLSVGAFTVHRTIQESIRTRGQAQDFTRARFLISQTMGEILEQPLLVERSDSGTYEGDDSRFSWTSEIKRATVPVPKAPLRPRPPKAPQVAFEYVGQQDYLARVTVTVTWQRSGMSFSESSETLLAPTRLWQPPRVRKR